MCSYRSNQSQRIRCALRGEGNADRCRGPWDEDDRKWEDFSAAPKRLSHKEAKRITSEIVDICNKSNGNLDKLVKDYKQFLRFNPILEPTNLAAMVFRLGDANKEYYGDGSDVRKWTTGPHDELESLLDLIKERIEDRIEDFNSYDLANTVLGLANCGYDHRSSLNEALVRQALKLYKSFNLQDMSMIVQGFGMLNAPCVTFFNKLVTDWYEKLQGSEHNDPYSIANILYGLALLNMPLEDAANKFIEKAGTLVGESNLLWDSMHPKTLWSLALFNQFDAFKTLYKQTEKIYNSQTSLVAAGDQSIKPYSGAALVRIYQSLCVMDPGNHILNAYSTEGYEGKSLYAGKLLDDAKRFVDGLTVQSDARVGVFEDSISDILHALAKVEGYEIYRQKMCVGYSLDFLVKVGDRLVPIEIDGERNHYVMETVDTESGCAVATQQERHRNIILLGQSAFKDRVLQRLYGMPAIRIKNLEWLNWETNRTQKHNLSRLLKQLPDLDFS